MFFLYQHKLFSQYMSYICCIFRQNKSLYKYIYIYIYPCMYVCMYVCTYMYIPTYTYIYTYIIYKLFYIDYYYIHRIFMECICNTCTSHIYNTCASVDGVRQNYTVHKYMGFHKVFEVIYIYIYIYINLYKYIYKFMYMWQEILR